MATTLASFSARSTPTWSSAGSPMGRLYALDAVSGAVRWTRDVTAGERRVVFAPIRAGALVVASFTAFDSPPSGGLVAFDRAGRCRWRHRFDAGAGAAGPPVVVGDVVVVGRTDGRIEAVRPDSGRRAWMLAAEASPPDDMGGRDIRALASSARQLLATSLKGPIRAYDVRGRQQRWAFDDGPIDAVALRVRVYGDQLYVPYTDGSLVAIDVRTGTEHWRIGPAADSFDWPPAASATSIVASGAGALWAFNIQPLESDARPESGGSHP